MRARTPYLYPHAHQHRAPRRLTEVGGRGAEKGAAGAWRKEKRAAGEEEGPPQARGGVGSPHLGDPETVRTALIKNISSPTILRRTLLLSPPEPKPPPRAGQRRTHYPLQAPRSLEPTPYASSVGKRIITH